MTTGGPGISITVDANRLHELRVNLNAMPQEVMRALRSTTTRMAGWLSSRVRRQLARQLRVPTRVLQKRVVRARFTGGGAGVVAANVWVGLNPVAVIHFGARQSSRGVTARVNQSRTAIVGGDGRTRQRLQGAFIRRIGGKEHVFKRLGDARLPITKLTAEIEAAGLRAIQAVVSGPEFGDAFVARFEQELRWRISRRP